MSRLEELKRRNAKLGVYFCPLARAECHKGVVTDGPPCIFWSFESNTCLLRLKLQKEVGDVSSTRHSRQS